MSALTSSHHIWAATQGRGDKAAAGLRHPQEGGEHTSALSAGSWNTAWPLLGQDERNESQTDVNFVLYEVCNSEQPMVRNVEEERGTQLKTHQTAPQKKKKKKPLTCWAIC